MGKKVYVPPIEQLEQMKSNDFDKYVLAKAVEKLLADYRKYTNDNFDDAVRIDESLRDIKDIITSICYIYPYVIDDTKEIQNDRFLCQKILKKKSDDSIYSLDNIARFSPEVQSDINVISYAADILGAKLSQNPEYRFNYCQSLTLDNLFLLNVPELWKLSCTDEHLLAIDPAYAFVIDGEYGNHYKERKLSEAVNKYAERYGFYYVSEKAKSKKKELLEYLYK